MDVKEKKMPKNILELFYKLSDTNTSIRVHACASILRILLKLQSENENEGEVCKDLQYVLKRLVQGLASSREAARLGFTLLLREVLVHIRTVPVERILELIKRKLSLAMAEEKRDAVFGQLFAYTALVRSGRLADDNHLPEVVLSIYELCQEKNYILVACYEITINLFTQLSKEIFKENVWPHLKKKIFSGWENCTPDSIWLLLLCLRMFPEITERYLTKHWGNCDVFSPENLEHHKNMIKQTGALFPQLHPYCLEFIALVKERKDIKEIWIPVVDENLFDIAHHEQRVYVGFEMIKKILQATEKKKVIKCVLAPKFSSKFMNVYMHPKHVLNPAAEKLAAFLCDYAKKNSTPEIQILILKTFLQMPSTVLLDRILKKKDVSELIQNLLPEAVKEFCELLKTVVLDQENENIEGKSVTSSKYFYAVVQIGNLLSHPVMTGDIEWRLNIMKFLFLHSFFNVKVPCEDILHCEHACSAVPDKLREFFVSSFYKSFYSLSHTSKNQRTPLHQFLEYLLSLAEYADQLIVANENVSPDFPIEKIQEAWKHMKSVVHKLIKQDKKENVHEAKIFQTLLLQLGFHLFHDPQHIPEALEELNICCKKALKAQKQLDQTADEENEPPWIGVVVDVLLSLLSNSSHHMHRLIISVFPLLCPFITKEALQVVLDVINPQNPSQEEMEIESGEENEEVEFVSESSSDEEVSNTDKVDEEFREKVKSALGSAAEPNGSDVESVVLSDSEMFQLDEALSKAFQSSMKLGHTRMSSEDKAMYSFRIRCLDLIITYLKSEPPMHLVLQCIEPVLAAYEFGHIGEHQKQLQLKAVSTIQVMAKLRKFQDTKGVEKGELKRLLDVLIAKCHKENNLTIATKIYSLCVFLVLCFRKMEIETSAEKKKPRKLPAYMKMYLSALDTFVKGKSSMLPLFFVAVMDACPDVAWNFIEPCITYAFHSDIRMYKRTQCLGLISEALKFAKGQKDVSLDQWLELGNKLIPAAVEGLRIALTDFEMKPSHITELSNVLYMTDKLVKEKAKQSLLQKHSDLLPLLTSVNRSKVKKLTKRGYMVWRKIILLLGGSITNKNNEMEQMNDSSDVMPKKRKSSKQSKKTKRRHTDVSSNMDIENSENDHENS